MKISNPVNLVLFFKKKTFNHLKFFHILIWVCNPHNHSLIFICLWLGQNVKSSSLFLTMIIKTSFACLSQDIMPKVPFEKVLFRHWRILLKTCQLRIWDLTLKSEFQLPNKIVLFASMKAFKIVEKCFLNHLKSSFCSQNI